jgi:HD-like signal output (HDOD) protein
MHTPTSEPPVVEAAVRSISQIATLPEITLRIIGLVEDPASTAHDLHSVIANDPALCTRILKVVNSAFYGLPRQVGSINRAIVLLGLNAVKNIAIAASLNNLFRIGERGSTFSARDLWIHCIATATASKLISDEIDQSMSDEAFLAGLIHDIGIMVEMQVHRAKLVQIFTELSTPSPDGTPLDMRKIERRMLGADHCDFGAALCELWRFPPALVDVTSHHHEPLALPESKRLLPTIVHVADRLAGRLDLGFKCDLVSLEVGQDVLDELQLTQDQLDAICQALPEAYAEVESTFTEQSVDV